MSYLWISENSNSRKSREFKSPETLVLCFLMNASTFLCYVYAFVCFRMLLPRLSSMLTEFIISGLPKCLDFREFFNLDRLHNHWTSEVSGFQRTRIPGNPENSKLQRLWFYAF